MPDTSVRIFKGEFPDQDEFDRLRLGDRFLWIPSAELRRQGVHPVLYTMKLRTYRGRKVMTADPSWPIPGVEHGC